MKESITLQNDSIVIRVPYEQVERCKSIPSAKWNKRLMAWVCPATPTAARDVVEAFGWYNVSDDICELRVASYEVCDVAQENNAIPFTTYAPFEHQRIGYHLIRHKHCVYLADDMGTGKTKQVCDYIKNEKPQTALIICPLAACNVWVRELQKHEALIREQICTNKSGWASAKRASLISYAIERRSKDQIAVIVNYESVWRAKMWETLNRDWDLIVCDEAHKIKSHKGKASKAIAELGKRARKRVCLSGTPLPHSPLDAFAQFRFLDPDLFGPYFTRFRHEYAVMGGFEGKQVVDFKNLDKLRARMDRHTRRVTKEQAIDLPPEIDVIVPVTLPANARKVYDELDKTLIAELEQGELTAMNSLVKLLRLQQLTSGSIPVERQNEKLGTIETVHVDCHAAKQDALQMILEGIDEKEPVVVFCKFLADLDRVHEMCAAMKRPHAELSGRAKNIGAKWNPRPGEVAVVQIESGGIAVDLSAASHDVFFSTGYNGGAYQQARARTHRTGQTRHVTHHHLVATDTVDERIVAALEKRENVAKYVLEYAGKEGRF